MCSAGENPIGRCIEKTCDYSSPLSIEVCVGCVYNRGVQEICCIWAQELSKMEKKLTSCMDTENIQVRIKKANWLLEEASVWTCCSITVYNRGVYLPLKHLVTVSERILNYMGPLIWFCIPIPVFLCTSSGIAISWLWFGNHCCFCNLLSQVEECWVISMCLPDYR